MDVPGSQLFRKLRALRPILARLLGRWQPPSASPEDPYAGVRQPRKPAPTSRHAAVALKEPD